MNDIANRVNRLRRPRLLIDAAKIGVECYSRSTHLPRYFGGDPLPDSWAALEKLMAIEAQYERGRRGGEGVYKPSHHVALLIAILGEAQLLHSDYAPPLQRVN